LWPKGFQGDGEDDLRIGPSLDDDLLDQTPDQQALLADFQLVKGIAEAFQIVRNHACLNGVRLHVKALRLAD